MIGKKFKFTTTYDKLSDMMQNLMKINNAYYYLTDMIDIFD